MSLSEFYKAAYMRLGCRPLVRTCQGYDPARQREKSGGPPSQAIVSDKSRQIIGKLERLWKPRLNNIVLKVNYFCGAVTLEHFLAMGTNLMMCELMDYYTVDLWTETISEQLQRPSCVICSADGPQELMVCAGCRQLVYCSQLCQRRHWKSGHNKECKVIKKVYQTSKLEESNNCSKEDMELLREMLTLSMRLVEEAEHQFYEDNGGREWLLLEEYKMPPFAKTDIEMNMPLKVLHPYFFQSVNSFRPRMTPSRHHGTNYLDRWGLPPEFEQISDDPMDYIKFTMNLSNHGLLDNNKLPCQQIQFIDKLIARKQQLLEKTRMDSKNSPDFILRIELLNTEPKVWRRFQCPSNIPLFSLADKILTPIMGWVRNFHAYTFVDINDGAHFGPSQMSTVDTVHIKTHFYKFMDDCDVQLGQLIRKMGDRLVWVYDLGDYWEHMIFLEKVVKPAGVTLLDGEMSCPPENEKSGWQENVLAKLPPKKKWDGPCMTKISDSLRQKLYMTIKTMVNLKESGQYLFADHCMYDPYHFDLDHHLKMLKNALATNLRSKTEGGKVFCMDLSTGFFVKKNSNPHRYRSGCAPRQTENGMFESVDLRRDQKELALCANCGSTRDLLMCKSCKQIYYCGEKCQEQHWHNGGHKDECSLLRKIHKTVKKEEKADLDGKTNDDKTGAKPKHSASDYKKKVDNLQNKDLFTKTNKDHSRVALLEKTLTGKGIFFKNEYLQKKFMIYSCHFNDEELTSLEEVESFSNLKKLFNTLLNKYEKIVNDVAEELGDAMPDDWEGVQKLTQTALSASSKNKYKNKKDANKRKLRRKML